MKNPLLLSVSLALTTLSSSASIIGYDSRTGATLGFTSSSPRTFIGQGFDIADPGGSPSINSMRIAFVAGTTLDYADTRIRVQFWDTYNSAASQVFANPVGGLQTFNTGRITASGATAFTFTLNFASSIPLTGLTGHGVSVNWQSDPTGTGTFANDGNLTAALRTVGSANIAVGANDNPNSGYYRNVSGQTDFNFASTHNRTLSSVTNGGLVFDLTVDGTAVPEPSTMAMSAVLVVLGGLLVARRTYSQRSSSGASGSLKQTSRPSV